MEEDISRRTISITVSAGKLTGGVLAAVCRKALEAWHNHQNKELHPHGEQTVKQLMGQGGSVSSVPLDEHTRLFDRVARKYGVDYAFHKTGPGKYQLFFKAGQADAITAAFSEYTKKVMRKEHRPSIRRQLQKFGEKARQQNRQRQRTREAARGDR